MLLLCASVDSINQPPAHFSPQSSAPKCSIDIVWNTSSLYKSFKAGQRNGYESMHHSIFWPAHHLSLSNTVGSSPIAMLRWGSVKHLFRPERARHHRVPNACLDDIHSLNGACYCLSVRPNGQGHRQHQQLRRPTFISWRWQVESACLTLPRQSVTSESVNRVKASAVTGSSLHGCSTRRQLIPWGCCRRRVITCNTPFLRLKSSIF